MRQVKIRGKELWRVTWEDSGVKRTRHFEKLEDAQRFEGLKDIAISQRSQSLLNLFSGYPAALEARGLGRTSLVEKRSVYEAFTDTFGIGKNATEVKYGDLEAFLGNIAKEVSRKRANRYRIHLVAAWNWGIKSIGLPRENQWEVEKFREDKSERYIPSIDDFWKVVAVSGDIERRILVCALHTAARRMELLNLTWEDVDFQGETVRLWTGKRSGGREHDLIPMTADVKSALTEQRKVNNNLRGSVWETSSAPLSWYAHRKMLSSGLCPSPFRNPVSCRAYRPRQ